MANSSREDAAAPTLRWAEAGEAAALATVHAQAFDSGWSEADLAALMASPSVFTAVIEQDGPAAFAMAREAAGEVELLTIAVAPSVQRRGWASALLEALTARARALGAEVVYLEVAVDNAPALALYERAGFERAGLRPAYYARPDGTRADALVLRRALNTPAA